MGEIIRMNWFKIAKDFSERNHINNKLRTLSNLRERLDYISKLIFQSGYVAKDVNTKIITSKEITSYPTIHNILIEADEIALDSPWKFQELCKEAIDKINSETYLLKKQREEFVFGDADKKELKGLK